MTVTGPPDDYTDHLKTAAYEALSMTDIVERLRDMVSERNEAANEIERLTAVLREIRELENNKIVSGEGLFMRALLIARRALEPKT